MAQPTYTLEELSRKVDAISEFLNEKTDRNLLNLNTVGQVIIDGKASIDLDNLSPVGQAKLGKAQIVDTYINGTSGYRIWSDGYCEQWGQSTTTNGTVSITFVKPFKTVVGGSSAILNSAAHFTSIMALTTTGCAIEAGHWGSSGALKGTGTTAPLAWVIYGYLADGQY